MQFSHYINSCLISLSWNLSGLGVEKHQHICVLRYSGTELTSICGCHYNYYARVPVVFCTSNSSQKRNILSYAQLWSGFNSQTCKWGEDTFPFIKINSILIHLDIAVFMLDRMMKNPCETEGKWRQLIANNHLIHFKSHHKEVSQTFKCDKDRLRYINSYIPSRYYLKILRLHIFVHIVVPTNNYIIDQCFRTSIGQVTVDCTFKFAKSVFETPQNIQAFGKGKMPDAEHATQAFTNVMKQRISLGLMIACNCNDMVISLWPSMHASEAHANMLVELVDIFVKILKQSQFTITHVLIGTDGITQNKYLMLKILLAIKHMHNDSDIIVGKHFTYHIPTLISNHIVAVDGLHNQRVMTKRKNCNIKSEDWKFFYGDLCWITQMNEREPIYPYYDNTTHVLLIDFLKQNADIYHNSDKLSEMQQYVGNVLKKYHETDEKEVEYLLNEIAQKPELLKHLIESISDLWKPHLPAFVALLAEISTYDEITSEATFNMKAVDSNNNIQYILTPTHKAPYTMWIALLKHCRFCLKPFQTVIKSLGNQTLSEFQGHYWGLSRYVTSISLHYCIHLIFTLIIQSVSQSHFSK